MRKGLIVMAVVVLAGGTALQAQAQGSYTLVRAQMRNDVGIELLGKALIYSFHYQRMFANALALDVGLGMLGSGSSTEDATLLFVPFGAKVYIIPKNGTIFLSGGAVFLSASTTAGPFDPTTTTDFYGQVGLGFEFRSTGGFLFRGSAYNLFSGSDYFIWPGLTVGYAF